MRTEADQKRIERTLKRQQGFILKQLWVTATEWPKLIRYLKRLRASQEGK